MSGSERGANVEDEDTIADWELRYSGLLMTQKSAVLSYYVVEAWNHTLWLFLTQWHSHIPENLNM